VRLKTERKLVVASEGEGFVVDVFVKIERKVNKRKFSNFNLRFINDFNDFPGRINPSADDSFAAGVPKLDVFAGDFEIGFVELAQNSAAFAVNPTKLRFTVAIKDVNKAGVIIIDGNHYQGSL
jgi:hypothetical protein